MSDDNAREVIDKNVIEGTRYFISLVELGSYTAVKNFYSVEINTVKSKLELLENYLGAKLTKPGKNKTEITSDGMKYYASCHRLYTDLENSILSSKYKGMDNLDYIRVFGTRIFINYIAPRIHEIDDANKYTFTFDSYLLYQANSYYYQLINYDIAIILSSDLEKIDQDHWVVCASIDSASLPSKIYVSQKMIDDYDLINNPNNVFKAPFITRRDDFRYGINITVDGKESNVKLDNIKYVVEDDSQKARLIEQGLGVGVLTDRYAQIFDSSIESLQSIVTSTYHDKVTIVVSKHIKQKSEIIAFLRDIADRYVKTVLGGSS